MVTNPGPAINNVDSTLTVKAPYSQSDITVFGANAGQKCVAMRLCALIYTTIQGINKCNDLVQIMEMVPSIIFCAVTVCKAGVFYTNRFTVYDFYF